MIEPGHLSRAIRPMNCMMAAAAVWIGASIGSDEFARPDLPLIAAMSSAAALLGFANLLNALNDSELDERKGKVGSQIGRLDRRGCYRMLFAALTASLLFAIACVLASGTPTAGAIYGSALVLVILYETTFKDKGLSGNAVVGASTGMAFLLGGSLGGLGAVVVSISSAASIVSMAREVLKDVEDMDADSGFRRSLPLVKGPRAASMTAFALAFISIPFILYPVLSGDGNVVYLVLILLSIASVAGSAIVTFNDPGRAEEAQKGVKVSMLVAMAAFISLFAI